MSWKTGLNTINKLASKAKDIEAITSGSPAKMGKRVKNKAKAKALAKSSFWRW